MRIEAAQILKILMKISWGIAFGGIFGMIIFCSMDFYYSWIIAIFLIMIAVIIHKCYEVVYGNKVRFESRAEGLMDSSISHDYNQLKKMLINSEKLVYQSRQDIRDKLKAFLIGSIICFVIATISIMPGFIDYIDEYNDYIDEYNYSPERISVEWTDIEKINDDQLKIVYEIKSEKEDVNYLVFDIIIYKNGKKIGTLTNRWEDAKLSAGKIKKATFYWTKNEVDLLFDNVKNTELSELTYEVEIKNIYFEDGTTYHQ